MMHNDECHECDGPAVVSAYLEDAVRGTFRWVPVCQHHADRWWDGTDDGAHLAHRPLAEATTHRPIPPIFFENTKPGGTRRANGSGRVVGHGIEDPAGSGAQVFELRPAIAWDVHSDDAEIAAEYLRGRIYLLHAERVRVRAYNESCRRGVPDVSLLVAYQEAQIAVLARVAPCRLGEGGAFPACHLSNLDVTILAARKGLTTLESRSRARAEKAEKAKKGAPTPGYGRGPRVVAPNPIHPAPRLRTEIIEENTIMAISCDPVGCLEIAERLGVNRVTPHVWVRRGLLPEPRWTVNGGAAWNWATIHAWAKKTGRLPRPSS